MILQNATSSPLFLGYVNLGTWLAASATITCPNELFPNESLQADITAGRILVTSMVDGTPGYVVRGEPVPADTVTYDNSTSGLTATDVQEGVDELSSADGVTYDNATSGLTATDVQAAIDEVAAADGVAYDNATSGLTATDVQAAIDEVAAMPITNYIIADETACDVAAPVNSVTRKYTLCGVAGNGFSLGDIIFDNGLNDTNACTRIAPKEGYLGVAQAALTNLTISDKALIIHNGTAWVELGTLT